MSKYFYLIAVVFGLLGFSYAINQHLKVTSNHIVVKKAQVDAAKMGPYGQSHFDKGRVSTEVKMDIINEGSKMATLVAATSPIARKVQLHHFVERGGKPVMQQIASINIQPHSQDDLSYQGVHIMLIGLKKHVKAGEMVPMTLIFADGSYLVVRARVA